MFGSWFVLVTVFTFATVSAENQPTKEIQTPDESHGGETQTAESDGADLGLVIQNAVGHNAYEGNSSPKLMLQSRVANLQTIFSVAAKLEFITTTATSQERALSRHSSFEKNREHFPTAFRWAIEQETTVTSSSAQRLAPRLSSWVMDPSSITVPSSLNRLFVRRNRSERHFVTSSTTQEGQALLTKGRTYFLPQSSVFTEKTILSSTIVSSRFAPVGRNTNVGQANHASVFRTGNSSVTSPLSQRWVSRRTLDKMSSLGMQAEISDAFSGEKDKKTTVLIRELSTPTQNKASATTAFRDIAARSFRSTPSVRQTFQDKSRNFPSSGKETFTPSGREHGISTAALSEHPVLSSTPPVFTRKISVEPPRGTVNSLHGTTDGAERKPSDSSTMEMMASLMGTPSGTQTQSKSNSQDKESVIAETLILGSTSSPPPVSELGSQILGAPTKSVEMKRKSEAHVTSHQTVAIASSSSHEGTFSRINVGFSSTGKASRTPPMPPSSLGGLHTSFANSITVASSSSKFSRALSESRAFSRASLPDDATHLTSASTVTDKLSSSSKTAALHSRERELHPSVSRPLVVSSSVKVVVVSSESPISFQTSQLEDTSAFSTTAVPPRSENALSSLSLKTIAVSSAATPMLKPSESQLSLATSVLGTAQSETESKSRATTFLRPTDAGLKTSLPSLAIVPSTTKLVVMSSESPSFLRRPSVSVQLSSSPPSVVPRSMSLSQTISSSELPLYTSTGLKSSELLRATQSSTVTSSMRAELATRTVDVSPNKAVSTVPQFLGSLSHPSADVNITVTTTYQRMVATAGLSAAQSSDGVGLATLSPRFSSPVLATGQPTTGSTSSSSDVKQPTAIPRFTSRDKSVGRTSLILKPNPTSTSWSSSSTSFALPLSSSPPPERTSSNPSNMSMLILVATVPSVFLGIIIGLLICRYHRGKNRHKGTHYSIKVEYTDDVRRRPRKRANSRLDLAVNGIHIDLEFPNATDGRDSVRISRGMHLSEGQIRELQVLSHECNQKLEWLNEVLAKEVAPPFSGTDSGVLFRDSALESGGKIVRRESSKRSRDNFFLKRLLSREKDSITERGEESKKEAIEFKALPAAAEDTPMNDTIGGDAECSDKIHEVRSPECETLGTEIKSGGDDTDNQDKSPSSGNKMRYYPLARTRKESTRLRFETL